MVEQSIKMGRIYSLKFQCRIQKQGSSQLKLKTLYIRKTEACIRKIGEAQQSMTTDRKLYPRERESRGKKPNFRLSLVGDPLPGILLYSSLSLHSLSLLGCMEYEVQNNCKEPKFQTLYSASRESTRHYLYRRFEPFSSMIFRHKTESLVKVTTCRLQLGMISFRTIFIKVFLTLWNRLVLQE